MRRNSVQTFAALVVLNFLSPQAHSQSLDQQYREREDRRYSERNRCLNEYNNSEYSHVNGKDYLRYRIKGNDVYSNMHGVKIFSAERPLECKRAKGRLNIEETFTNKYGCKSRYLFKVEGKYLVQYSDICYGSVNSGVIKKRVAKLRLSASNENVDDFFDNMLP